MARWDIERIGGVAAIVWIGESAEIGDRAGALASTQTGCRHFKYLLSLTQR